MATKYFKTVLGIAFLLLHLSLKAQTDTSVILRIEGDIPAAKTFTAADLAAFTKMEVSALDMSGGAHMYSGIAVSDILKAAGIIKPEFHRDNLTRYVLVRSSDNYEVLFSLTELDSAFSGRCIILANLVDGKPLPPSKGPYRIVVPGEEKRQARWIWSVTTFVIRFGKD